MANDDRRNRVRARDAAAPARTTDRRATRYAGKRPSRSSHHADRAQQNAVRHGRAVAKSNRAPDRQREQEHQQRLGVQIGDVPKQHRVKRREETGEKCRPHVEQMPADDEDEQRRTDVKEAVKQLDMEVVRASPIQNREEVWIEHRRPTRELVESVLEEFVRDLSVVVWIAGIRHQPLLAKHEQHHVGAQAPRRQRSRPQSYSCSGCFWVVRLLLESRSAGFWNAFGEAGSGKGSSPRRRRLENAQRGQKRANAPMIATATAQSQLRLSVSANLTGSSCTWPRWARNHTRLIQ